MLDFSNGPQTANGRVQAKLTTLPYYGILVEPLGANIYNMEPEPPKCNLGWQDMCRGFRGTVTQDWAATSLDTNSMTE